MARKLSRWEQVAEIAQEIAHDRAVNLNEYDGLQAHHFFKNMPAYGGKIKVLNFIEQNYKPDWTKYVEQMRGRASSDNILSFLEFANNQKIDLTSTDKDGITLFNKLKDGFFKSHHYINSTNSFIDLSPPECLSQEASKKIDNEHIFVNVIKDIGNNFAGKKHEISVKNITPLLDLFLKKAYKDDESRGKAFKKIIDENNSLDYLLSNTPFNELNDFFEQYQAYFSNEYINKAKSYSILNNCFSTHKMNDLSYELATTFIDEGKFKLDNEGKSSNDLSAKIPYISNSFLLNRLNNFNIFVKLIKTQNLPLNDFNSPSKNKNGLIERMLLDGLSACGRRTYDDALEKMELKGLPYIPPSDELLKETFGEKVAQLNEKVKECISLGILPVLHPNGKKEILDALKEHLHFSRFHMSEVPLGLMMMYNNVEPKKGTNPEVLDIAKELSLPTQVVEAVMKAIENRKKNLNNPVVENIGEKAIEEFKTLVNNAVELTPPEKKTKASI